MIQAVKQYNTKKVYGGNLTGGALLVRESRIVAALMLDALDEKGVLEKVLTENLFQNNSQATTRKYCRLILLRLRTLTPVQLKIITGGTDESVRLMLMAGVLKSYSLVKDFFREVLFDKVKCANLELSKMDWSRFLEQRETIDPGVGEWTGKSRKKMGQVVIRMLKESGFLNNTREMHIQFPYIPPDVANSLEKNGEQNMLNYLKLGKAA